ncbi:EAL domain-containing protein [Clostridium aestuarii]|uniref:EAL domain-containing protein n=1 Tax=Clostridium aestuarii TaxID=338193 RepID=A0ABT4CWI0_9CLOT|nr:EAL domain-containing protein [Clostridium aestuarii]MCY6483339.1 EAL domain-containing protein [Clostridium aestuarii]
MKSISKKSIKMFSMLLILLIVLTFILIKMNLDIEVNDFFLEGICTIFAIIAFDISLKLNIKYLSIGWALLTISFFSDTIDELKFIELGYLIENIFEEVFVVVGIIFIGYGFYKAIEEKEKLLQNFKDIAFKDALTNLPNRRIIKERVTLAIKEAKENDKKVGVIFIDLDKFKLINDTFGHSIGDYFLKKVSSRLKDVVRKGEIIARLGGDEFIIVLNDINGLKDVEDVAKKIIEIFKHPFILKEKQIHITCSMGISLFPENGEDAETLFKNADIAMYNVKEKGRNNYKFYNNAMDNSVMSSLEVAESLRTALKKREFIIHYQPKINIRTGQVTGLEALIRWQHPKLGLIYPNDFILIAEETGLIKEIDEHILELACLQIKKWISDGLKPINIAVNISAKMFNNSEFIDKLESILTSTGIDTSYISIEITETAAMEDIERAYDILAKLKKKKIQIALDDFGKGYSSLSYLKTFPIDVLKIDKLFVDGIAKDKRDESLIKAAITMAKALEIKVISEGVETNEQLRFLNEIECDEYQGYLFSKPVVVEEIEAILGEKEMCW